MRYKPSETDVVWARALINTITDHGVWVAPATGLMYRFDKTKKTLTPMHHPKLLDRSFDAYVMHEQTKEVFKAIGWEME